MCKIKVIIMNKQKQTIISTGIRMLIRRCCNAVLVQQELEGVWEVNVSFVDDDEIARLNSEFRQINSSTDVLSFPLGENGKYDLNPETGAKQLGDIVISAMQAEKQAIEYGHSIQREVGYLTVHSMFHLLGYDHVNGGLEAVKMRENEEAVMAMLGVTR